MFVTRRDFLVAAAGSATAALARPLRGIDAVAFDAFVIFDPRPVANMADALHPGLADAWRVRQFEYSWLRACSGQYVDYWQVTHDALVYAAKSLRLELTAIQRDALLGGFLALPVWPDAIAALETLRAAGLRLSLLSNFTAVMLHANIRSAGLDQLFDAVVSTDRARTYKPDPRAYALGPRVVKVRRERMLFAVFAGWDAAGATQFGLRTFWVNRLQAPAEELGVTPAAVGSDLNELAHHLS
jgi:2-haloacid dehalogenase